MTRDRSLAFGHASSVGSAATLGSSPVAAYAHDGIGGSGTGPLVVDDHDHGHRASARRVVLRVGNQSPAVHGGGARRSWSTVLHPGQRRSVGGCDCPLMVEQSITDGRCDDQRAGAEGDDPRHQDGTLSAVAHACTSFDNCTRGGIAARRFVTTTNDDVP
jgi:hypothetical protein